MVYFGKTWIPFTPDRKKKKKKNQLWQCRDGLEKADGHWVQEKELKEQFFSFVV